MRQTSKNLKRRPTPKKASQPPLKQQSQKIQTKLESLRAQIESKKKQKIINNKNQNLNSTKTTMNSRVTSASNKIDNESALDRFLKNSVNKKQKKQSNNNASVVYIEDILKSLGIPDKFVTYLYQKSITNINQLMQRSQEQINNWKDFPIGHRIKLRKFINIARQQKQQRQYKQQKQQKQQRQQKQQKYDDNINKNIKQNKQSLTQNNKQQYNIEDIIDRRQKNQIFVKIIDRQEEQYEQNMDVQYLKQDTIEQKQDEEDIMIQSLNQAFFGKKQRKSIIRDKQKSNQKQKKEVHWDKSVKNYDRSNKKVYTQQNNKFVEFSQSKRQLNYQIQSLYNNCKSNNLQYCWICLTKINNLQAKIDNRLFCSPKCIGQYQQIITLTNKHQQQITIQHLSNQQLSEYSNQQLSEQSMDDHPELEVIDLTL